MNLKIISINKENFGITFEKVNALITELHKINNINTKNDLLEVHLTVEESQICELSLALTQRYLYLHKNLNCKKQIIINKKSIDSFSTRNFFGSLGGKNNFFGLTSKKIPINYETFTTNKEEGTEEFMTNIFESVTSTFLQSDKRFHSELKGHIFELINNTFDHCKSDNDAISICHLKDNDIFEFCITDLGIDIKKSFISNPKLKNDYMALSEHEVISRATEHRISCNPDENPHPDHTSKNGGIGLYFLKKFINCHHLGHMVIVSGYGYFYTDKRGKVKKKKKKLKNSWPGTAVYFRVRLQEDLSEEFSDISEKNMLLLDEEIGPDIFV